MNMDETPGIKDPLCLSHWCTIRDNKVMSESNPDIFHEIFSTFTDFIKALYKKENPGYPKFYKMDNLSKMGFMATEIVLRNSRAVELYNKERIGVILANSSSSLDTDMGYQDTIRNKSDYFPSPAVFVYTLANIVIGEICIRHGIKGENAFFISEKFDPVILYNNITAMFDQGRADACIGGWVEVLKEKHDAFVFLVQKRSFTGQKMPVEGTMIPFNEKNLLNRYLNQSY
jgi:hypothetical protein